MGPHYLKLAEQLPSIPLGLAHGTNLLSLANVLELALGSL